MKKAYLLLIIVSLPALILAQNTEEYFYYYNGEKQPLELNTEYLYIASHSPKLTNKNMKQATNKMVLKEERHLSKIKSRNGKSNTIYAGELKLNRKYSKKEYNKLLASLRADKDIEVVSPYFKTKDADKIGVSRFFLVKLKSLSDTTMLYKFAKEQKTVVLKQDAFMPLWFYLSCTKQTTKNILETANIFYESGLFASASPDFLTEIQYSCANDTYFSDQWGLKNTGQYGGTAGIDINACEAWTISKGAGVTVAVVDDGVELSHLDLQENIHSFSYDIGNNSSPSTIRGSHGTACAGIVAAADNNIGTTGVAPNCKLMSISSTSFAFSSARAFGINKAVENGADIINNSWFLRQPYDEVTDAISNALNNGRGGKGCVVVFASGNNNGAVSYPANTNPDILVVGAMSLCGERKRSSSNVSELTFYVLPDSQGVSCDGESSWGSNYGVELDIMAPGVLIPTTDIRGGLGYNPNDSIHPGSGGNKLTSDYADKDYTVWFNGTSAACPHVSGVVALMLSVNPELTGKQVRNIIELTAQKVGGYNYSTHTNRPNGTWNEEVGYGLVDAYAAVQLASALVNVTDITGPDLICDQETYTIENLPANTPVQWSTNNSNLTLVSGQGTGTAVFHKNGNGECTVKANVANSSVKLNKKVWVGKPQGYSNFYATIYTNAIREGIEPLKIPKSKGAIFHTLEEDYPEIDFCIGVFGNSINVYIDLGFSMSTSRIEGKYTVLIITSNECGAQKDSGIVSVERYYNGGSSREWWSDNTLNSIFISPNNDGINDALSFSNLSSEKLVMGNHIVIYNSQGLVVYEGYGDENFRGFGNVGSYAGVALPEGVYFYKTMGRCTTSGSIYLRR